MAATPEGGWYELAICFDFSFEFGETCVVRIATYLRQQGVAAGRRSPGSWVGSQILSGLEYVW